MRGRNDMETGNPYDDLLTLPHPVSERRATMSRGDRAAQFSPFAALTGFEDTIGETARLTDTAICLDENRVEELDRILRMLKTELSQWVQVLYFQPDAKKAGGRYLYTCGVVKQVDGLRQLLILEEGTQIPFDRIYGLEVQKNTQDR